MNTMYLQLNSFQKLLGSTPTPSRLAPPYNTFISLNLVRNRALSRFSLSFTHKIQSLNPIISDDANHLGRPLPLLCRSTFIFSHWTTAMASKPVSLFWASLTSIFPPHTGCWSNLPKAWTQTCSLLFKSLIWYPSQPSVWVRSKVPNHAFWKDHQIAIPNSNTSHRSSPPWLPPTTPCSRATTWHTMPLLSRMSLEPSPSGEISYPSKPSLNITKFMKHSADLFDTILLPPGSHTTPCPRLYYYYPLPQHQWWALHTPELSATCLCSSGVLSILAHWMSAWINGFFPIQLSV